jgi:predicted transcriptional regulator
MIPTRATMSTIQIEKRIEALERTVEHLARTLEYQQAVDGIRRGLESAARGEGVPARSAFARLRQKHKIAKP